MSEQQPSPILDFVAILFFALLIGKICGTSLTLNQLFFLGAAAAGLTLFRHLTNRK